MRKNSQLSEVDALARSRIRRVALAKQARAQYLEEIAGIIHETDFYIKHTEAPPKRMPNWLSSPKPIKKLVVHVPEDPEEKYKFLNTPPKSSTPKRPLRKVHYTKRFNGGVDDYMYVKEVKLPNLEEEYAAKNQPETPQQEEFEEEEMIASPASPSTDQESDIDYNDQDDWRNKPEELIQEKLNEVKEQLEQIFDENSSVAKSSSFENSPLANNDENGANSTEEEDVQGIKVENTEIENTNEEEQNAEENKVEEEEDADDAPFSPDSLGKEIFAKLQEVDTDSDFEVDAYMENIKNNM